MRRRPASVLGPLLIVVLLAGSAACSGDPGRSEGSDGDRLLEVPDGGAEPTTPVTDLPPAPIGGARARVEWQDGRQQLVAELDDAPSACTLDHRPEGDVLVVDIGDEATAGLDRASDFLHLEAGPIGQTEPYGSTSEDEPDDLAYLATVQELDLVVSGGDPPAVSGRVLALVDGDLRSARLPLGDGSVEITCLD